MIKDKGMKFPVDKEVIVKLTTGVDNIANEPGQPKRFEKGQIGVCLYGQEKPEKYHVDFFAGEPYLSDYIGCALVGPDDISAVEDE